MSIRSLIDPALELQETLEDNLVSAKDKIVKTTQETLPKLNEAAEPVIDYAQDIWSRTKEFKDARNPLNWGHNIGAVGARGLESFATIDAENPQELGMELLDKTLGAKGVGLSIVKEIPVVKPIVKTAERYTDEALKNLWNGFRNRRIYSTVGVGVPEEVVTTLGKQADELGIIAGQPLKSLSGVSPGTTQPGYARLEGLKNIVYSDVPIQKDVQGFVKTGKRELLDSKQTRVQRYLEEGPSKHLDSKYKDRRGYLNAEKLSKNSRLLKQIIDKHDEVTELFKTYRSKKRAGASAQTLSKYQRELYEKIGENYFSDSALIYGQDKFRDKLVAATKWFSKDHWHHIFGNKEWGEFMLTEIAQDPLIAVNLYKHLKKAKLSTAGVSENLLIMKQAGHNNLHEFFKHIGIQPRFANRAPANFEDIGQEISRTVRGEAKAAKTFTTETGEVITKGTPYPKDPEAVNHLFTMIDAYAKHNKWVRKKFDEGVITVMEPIGDKAQRVVVPNGYKPKKGEIVEVFDLTANKGGKPRAPEVYAHKVGRIKKQLLIEQ